MKDLKMIRLNDIMYSTGQKALRVWAACILGLFVVGNCSQGHVRLLCNCWRLLSAVEINQTCLSVQIAHNCSPEVKQHYGQVEYVFILRSHDYQNVGRFTERCSLSQTKCTFPCIPHSLGVKPNDIYEAVVHPNCQECSACHSRVIHVSVAIDHAPVLMAPPQVTSSQYPVFIFGIVGAVIMVVIVTSVIYLVKNKRRRQREEPTEAFHVVEEAMGPNYEKVFAVAVFPLSPGIAGTKFKDFREAIEERCSCNVRYISPMEMNPYDVTDQLLIWSDCIVVVMDEELCRLWVSDEHDSPYEIVIFSVLEKIRRHYCIDLETKQVFFVNFDHDTTHIDSVKSKLGLNIQKLYSVFHFTDEDLTFLKLISHFRQRESTTDTSYSYPLISHVS